MNPIDMMVLSTKDLQVGKKYVVLYQHQARIVEVLEGDIARMQAVGMKIGSYHFNVDMRNLHFLMELPEEKQQSIFDNPYYEVEAARLQGKTIQFRGHSGVWEDAQSAPSYFFPPEDYRIKPETKTVYRCRYEYEDVYGQSVSSCWANEAAANIKLIKYIHENSQAFKKWIIEPECTPIEVEVN